MLWATNGKSDKNSRKSSKILNSIGSSFTILSDIPVISVINGSIDLSGLIKVINRSTGSPL